MTVAETTITQLFDNNYATVADICQSLNLPEVLVRDVLERNSPRYRAQSEILDLSKTSPEDEEDINNAQFARIRQEAFQIATDKQYSEFCRSGMLKFLWNKKRPETQAPTVNVNVIQINEAIDRAREKRAEKFATPVIETNGAISDGA